MKGLRVSAAVTLTAVFVFFCFSGALGQEGKIVPEKKIKAHKIIRSHYVGGLTPAEITVAPGTTIIWVNDSRSSVEIQFEGKDVTLACKSPVHFVIDEKGSFISDRIPQGSVASLCMVEKGEFNYVMRKAEFAGGYSTMQQRDSIKDFKGKIIVK